MAPPGAVKYYFYLWRDEGTDQDIHDLLRRQLREKRKRIADPSLVVLDTQSIHVAVGVPAKTTGRGAAKRVPGWKRCHAVDVLGLVIDCLVLTAPAHENTTGIALLDQVASPSGSVRKALADADRPMRARGLCHAFDLPILPKDTEDIRSKLKRLVSRGILIEPEPGLFARPDS
ncbi:hypothetical protein HLK59_02125 [Streptomyces sp. S3(2020)]|uniref:hypothetical protein n=1 Tax=Streptomyces sp. S3(2020) TaxID=2732044 RepID=UPI0014895705|nr:hypothetical protein [Streptomyces sp. S3(2020)]NNN29165.1 hypothetical protein [Streptomyces sp. S3(2020)]